MANATTSKPFPHALLKLTSATLVVQSGSTPVWKKDWAMCP